ncbi:Telomeric repeat-binding factor 2-interacting protein 1 [Tolypocladium ophioglossoides CBS 100239]|uniref:DNA-binding protein RAP1 n=1 Tax=Tolypocladium ophioglossoides (strain CBS 100239) TaxID=1163406 RepID=A0A0L0N2D2_TOLOC|nr:Telomeric repeat-binding factor 2-interacting protein 1 [Tolypocladium ophioglossoides CBS 100239]
MASVTYNGVASAQGGSIFKHVSFWVAQRVPSRDTILGHVRNNGGVVVALEKQADILIADHARKDAPAGSCSWKFVTESVDHGIMQLKDRYQIGPAPGVPRQVGSGRPIKRTRTPFTHADDVVLVKWVLSHDKSPMGNKMYQQIEAMNPRHTWQSWRNRFAKGLMTRGQHYLEQLASEELPAEVEEAMQDARDATENAANQTVDSPMGARPAVRAAATKARSPVKQQDAESEQPDPWSRVPETQEDDDLVAMMEEFYSDLEDFVEASGAEIEMEHDIGGKTIGLWELNQAVDAQKVPLDEVDWIKAAEDLGYDWDRSNQVPVALRQCYEANLVEFIEALSSFGRDEEDEGHQQASSPEADIPSSPPARSVRKRRSPDTQQLPSSGRAKRRRLSRDAEIPSTPDEKLGYPVRPRVSHTHSPSVQRNILRLGQTQSTDASQQLPPLPRQQRRGKREVVFETQIQPPARLESQQSAFSVTPSQQLWSEELDARPIPLDLERGRPDADRVRETETSHRGTAGASTQRPERLARHGESPQQEPRAARRNQPSSESGTSNQQQIIEVVEYYESLGYPNHIVVDALKRTTMTPGGLAALVMQSLKDGSGVPSHHEGIWTDRDDKSLRLVDAIQAEEPSVEPRERRKAKKEFDRLVAKHGLDQMELRRQFLGAEAAARNDAV